MKHLVSFLLLATLTLVARESYAENRVDLRAAMQRAAKGPQAEASRAQYRGARAAAGIERRLAILPTISLAGSVNLRDRDFSLVTPAGTFSVGDKLFGTARLRLSQPLFDPAGLYYRAPAARLNADAALQTSVRVSEQLAMGAAQQYLDILVLTSLRTSNDAYVQALRSRLKEVKTMVTAERAIVADSLEVQLALDRAILQGLVLKEKVEVGEYALGRALGSDGPIHAFAEGLPLDLDEYSGQPNLQNRPDLLALRSQKRAAEKRLSGVRADLLPKIVLNADMIYSDEGPQSETQFFQGSINVVWVPFASGTRSLRKKVHRAEVAALTRQHEELLRASRLELRQSQSGVRIAREQLAVAESSIVQTRQLLQLVQDRYASGREKISDVLAAEASLQNSLAQEKIAKIEVVRAQLGRKFASSTIKDWLR